jgi:tetratricopeptide (TPR) repeat protein
VRRTAVAALLTITVAWVSSACAPAHSGNRFIRKSGRGSFELLERPLADQKQMDAAVRDAMAAAKPPARVPHATIEDRNPELRTALRDLGTHPSAASHTRVGHAYRALGIFDRALDHFDAAIALDKRDAAAYDGRARVWRDWGILSIALADATRAVYFGESVSTRNTLATVLMHLGRCGAATRVLEQARALDNSATYVNENLAILARVAVANPERCADGPVTGSRQPKTPLRADRRDQE